MYILTHVRNWDPHQIFGSTPKFSNPMQPTNPDNLTDLIKTKLLNGYRMSLLNRVRCVSACERVLRASMLVCQCTWRANVPKACQLLIFTCQRVIRRSIVLSWRVNVRNGVLIFQLDVPTCQFFKHFSYEVLRKISLLYYYIINFIFYVIS